MASLQDFLVRSVRKQSRPSFNTLTISDMKYNYVRSLHILKPNYVYSGIKLTYNCININIFITTSTRLFFVYNEHAMCRKLVKFLTIIAGLFILYTLIRLTVTPRRNSRSRLYLSLLVFGFFSSAMQQCNQRAIAAI